MNTQLWPPNQTQKDGFTIVELLIVIVVIAVLATITIVAFTNLQTRAKSSVTKADLSNLDKKLYTYMIGHETAPGSIASMQANGFGATNKMTLNDGTSSTPRASSRVTPMNDNVGLIIDSIRHYRLG